MSPVFLKRDGEYLTAKLGGFDSKAEFTDNLQRVKSVPGKDYDFENKRWLFPWDADTALRLMQMVTEVAPDAEVKQLIQGRAAAVAESLITRLPETGNLAASPISQSGHRLRGYQAAAVEHIVEHRRILLADEMGLGKTIVSIAALVEAQYRGALPQPSAPALIIAPKALLGTWKAEIEEWTCEYAQIVAGAAGRRAALLHHDAPWFIINWEQLRNPDDVARLAKCDWSMIVADEAHRAKNRNAAQTRGLLRLDAPIKIAATGTPIMNSPDELWAPLAWLKPEQYNPTGRRGDFWPFHYAYVDEYPTKYGRVMTGVKNPDQLRFELRNILIRRTKADVMPELPPKSYRTVRVDLLPAQRRLYDAVTEELLLDVQRALADPEQAPKVRLAIEEAVNEGDHGALMYLIPNGAARVMRQRQVASSTALLGDEKDQSAKLDAAVELVRDNPGKPFVLFTWFKDTAELLANRLRRGKPPLRVGVIAGDSDPTPVKDAFQDGDLDCVVCTIAKGGVGLTLTAADTAIFVERDWVPAVNQQAEDRLHRIGQKGSVEIVILEANDTVDTGKIAPTNRLKELIVTAVFGESA